MGKFNHVVSDGEACSDVEVKHSIEIDDHGRALWAISVDGEKGYVAGLNSHGELETYARLNERLGEDVFPVDSEDQLKVIRRD